LGESEREEKVDLSPLIPCPRSCLNFFFPFLQFLELKNVISLLCECSRIANKNNKNLRGKYFSMEVCLNIDAVKVVSS